MKEKDEDDYIFSKEIRDALNNYKEKDGVPFISDPDFYEALFEGAGLSKKEQNDLWECIGRSDLIKKPEKGDKNV